MYIKELTNKEFNDFATSYSSYSIYQTSEYGFIMNNQKYTSLVLGMIDNDKIVAASLILIEKTAMFKYAYAPKGFLINYSDRYLVEEFTKLIKEGPFCFDVEEIARQICLIDHELLSSCISDAIW